MTQTPDQGTNLSQLTILLPGETAPTGTQDTAPAGQAASPTGDEDHLKAAFEAAGVKLPAPAAADASGSGLDPNTIELLKGLDPSKVPAEVLERFDRHFQPAFTKKTQALAEERRAFEQQREEWLRQREQALDKFASGKTPNADQQKLEELRERIRRNDPDALIEYMDQLSSSKLSPVQQREYARDAFNNAVAAEPLVNKHLEAIRGTFKQAPVLAELLQVENYRFAPLVYAAIARDIELTQVQQYVAGEAERTAAAVTKALNTYKERVRSLPDATTLAGTAQPGTVTEGPATTEAEARARLMRDLRGVGVVEA